MNGDRFSPESLDFDALLETYKPGKKVHGFNIVRSDLIPEINSLAILSSHDRTGLEHLHLASNDRENVFVLAVRTIPEDSRGTARILENMVLSGSKKYPCRDIFSGMRGRTQATYMGVSRMVDCTFYPIVTQHQKDFFNWMDILMDCIMRPTLTEEDFMREGWHFKFYDETSKTYHIGGAAYTESVLFMGNTQAYMHQKVINGLFPSHGYGNVVSGMPNEILKLTLKDVRAYHAKYFQPNNCSVYTYGDFPVDDTLKRLDDILTRIFPGKNVVFPPVTINVGDEPPWTEGRQQVVPCAPYKGDTDFNYGALAIGYALEDNGKIYENFCLRVLSLALLNGPSALIPKAFVDAYVTRGIVSDSGMDASLQTTYLTIGLQKILIHHVEIAIDTVNDTLLKIARDGIDKDFIEAILRQMEIAHKNRGNIYGLRMYRSIAGLWNHNPDPIGGLKFDALAERLRKDMQANTRYFNELTAKYFVYNPHRIVVTMQPDTRFTVDRGRLPVPVTEMPPKMIADHRKKMKNFDAVINAKLNKDVLPRLTLQELTITSLPSPVNVEKISGVSVSFYQQATNGVVHFRAVLGTGHVPGELKELLSLFCKMISFVGDNIKEKLVATAGELTASPIVVSDPTNSNLVEEGIVLFSYCLAKDAKYMFTLWKRIFNEWLPNDARKLRTLVQTILGNYFHNPESFLQLAWKHSARTMQPTAYVSEKLGGFNFFRILSDTEETADYEAMVNNLRKLRQLVMNKTRMRCSVNADANDIPGLTKVLRDMLDKLPGRPASDGEARYHRVEKEASMKGRANLLFPFPDYFTALSLALPPFASDDYPALLLAAKMIEIRCEKRQVLEHAKPGVVVQPTGVLTLFAQQDTHPISTVQILTTEVAKICGGRFTDDELEAARWAVFHEEDAPVPPSLRGMDHFLMAITEEMKTRHRDRILRTTRKKVAEVTKRTYASTDECNFGICVIGKKLTDIEDTNAWEFQYVAPI